MTHSRVRLVVLLGALACGGHQAAPVVIVRPSAPDGSANPRSEAVWRTVLENFTRRAIRSEADLDRRVASDFGGGPPGRSRIVLMLRQSPDSAPYRRAWLDSLVSDRVVDGTCAATAPNDCPDSGMTSFLSLGNPQFIDDTSATVDVSDVGTDPAACRRHAGTIMTGDEDMRVDVRRRGSWVVTNAAFVMGGTGFCGETPAEQQRMARLGREDSLLQRTSSPVAGTYRVVLYLGSGDSSVLFARTKIHPDCCGIRERRRGEGSSDEYRPILGYYLSVCVATSLSDLGTRCPDAFSQTMWAVSVDPVSANSDSSVWRGEIEPLVEVHHFDARESVRQGAKDLYRASEELRDPSWYFMPGTWITYRDGRARFTWTLTRGATLAFKVVADRLSTQSIENAH